MAHNKLTIVLILLKFHQQVKKDFITIVYLKRPQQFVREMTRNLYQTNESEEFEAEKDKKKLR